MKIYCPYENVSCLLFVAFWWKEAVFFSSFRQFKPIAVPRPVVLSTGSNALRPYYDWAVACSVQHIGRDLHFRVDHYRDAALLYHCSEDLPLNCCNCSAAGRAQRLEWVRRQLDPPATFSSILSQNVQLSTDDGAFARRVSYQALRALERKVCNPQIHHLHLPQHLSHLEARKTDNDNAKQQKRKKKTTAIVRSLSHAHKLRTLCSDRRRKGRLSAHPDGTIAVLDQTSAIFSLHNRAAGRGPYISYGRNLQTCLNRPENQKVWKIFWKLLTCRTWSLSETKEAIGGGTVTYPADVIGAGSRLWQDTAGSYKPFSLDSFIVGRKMTCLTLKIQWQEHDRIFMVNSFLCYCSHFRLVHTRLTRNFGLYAQNPLVENQIALTHILYGFG